MFHAPSPTKKARRFGFGELILHINPQMAVDEKTQKTSMLQAKVCDLFLGVTIHGIHVLFRTLTPMMFLDDRFG